MTTEERILEMTDLAAVRERHGGRIALCSGCYDILQSGHSVFFEQCKEFADVLVVAMGRDSVIRGLKGAGRPVNPEQNRAYLLASLREVDYVVLGEEELAPGKIDFGEIMAALKPDVFVLNDDDGGIAEKRALCESLGVALELVSRTVPDYLTPTSTTKIVDTLGKTAPEDCTQNDSASEPPNPQT